MTFNKSNTVEALIRVVLCGGITHCTAVGPRIARKAGAIADTGGRFLTPETCRAPDARAPRRAIHAERACR